MTKKGNTGKKLEKVVRLIHETLKDKPNTVIHSNYRVENISGQKREFDLFIESTINGTTIKIAVECKEYKSPVPVEKIEAFKSKCDRVPEINKKLFVSQSGYQKDALNAAKDFGIELYSVENITQNQILNWFRLTQLGLRFTVKEYKLVLATSEQELASLKSETFTQLYIGPNEEKMNIISLINEAVFDSKENLWNIALNDFLRNGGYKSVGKITTIQFAVGLPYANIISTTGEKYSVVGIECSLDAWLVETPPQVKLRQIYGTENQTKAGRISLDLGTNDQADIIITEDKFKIFHTDGQGNTNEFKLITKYDPKTDTFSKDE